jgi:uncharacterized protein (UPF0548 family)
VFTFAKPGVAEVEPAIQSARNDGGSSPPLLSLSDGLKGRKPPFAFVRDCLRSRIGEGEEAFVAARRAFREWAQFDLGWVRVANPEIPIAVGQIVAVEVHAFGFWSLNFSRIVQIVDSATRFGFLYATTSHHAEEGEERFLLEYNPANSGVWYHLEAVSRPRHPLARLAWPLTRSCQHRFARDSHHRMCIALRGQVS